MATLGRLNKEDTIELTKMVLNNNVLFIYPGQMPKNPHLSLIPMDNKQYVPILIDYKEKEN